MITTTTEQEAEHCRAMQQGLVESNLTVDLNLCAQNATITMTVNVLQNATSATELAIWLRSGGLGESNHMIAILVRESREMEDGLVILGGKWMKDTNDLTNAK
ncbi:hypothetical protein Tco_0264950 [Tanacetum coccineum]